MASSVSELAIKYHVGSVDCLLTHTLFHAFDETPDLEAVLDAWQGDPQDDFLDTQHEETELLTITAAWIAGTSTPDLAPITRDVNLPGTRSTVTSPLPPNVCATHTIRTAFGGRRARGRNFWSGGMEADIDSSGFIGGSGTFQDRINTYYATLKTAFADDSAPAGAWCVFSRRQHELTGMVNAARIVTSYPGHALVHTLRSRRS